MNSETSLDYEDFLSIDENSGPTEVSWNPNGYELAISYHYNSLIVYKYSSFFKSLDGKLFIFTPDDGFHPIDVEYSPDGKWLAFGY